MGLYHACYSTSPSSNMVDIAVLELYVQSEARSGDPGFDDILGEPFMPDGDDDGIGERTRPTETVELTCKAEFSGFDEQDQDQTGNAPTSSAVLTIYEDQLEALGLIQDGILAIRANDRLLRLKHGASGEVRAEFASGGRQGLRCFGTMPGKTGTGTWKLSFEGIRVVGD